jgi:3-oxoacyl-[acyl-carrier-protein] synthase-3
MQARITAIGSYAPEQIIDNQYFEGIIETSDEWIQSRTGIITRRFAHVNQYTSHLCIEAARDLSNRYNKPLEDVDFILVATVSHDQIMPSMATQLQHHLGIPNTGALDISAACAGFGYGIVLAKSLVNSGMNKKVLVIGGETLSKITDFSDRTSCILFGDGAGAVLVEAATEGNIGASLTGAEGSGGQDLYLSNYASQVNGEQINANGKIYQNGRKVFKWAVQRMAEKFDELLDTEGITINELDWFVPHSANMRIIEAICSRVGLPIEKALESISDFGNTSSASIPLALDKGVKAGKVKPGDKVMLLGFGGGLAYAGAIVEWGI